MADVAGDALIGPDKLANTEHGQVIPANHDLKCQVDEDLGQVVGT